MFCSISSKSNNGVIQEVEASGASVTVEDTRYGVMVWKPEREKLFRRRSQDERIILKLNTGMGKEPTMC